MDATPSLRNDDLITVSRVYTRTGFANEPAKLGTLSALAGTVMPGQARDLPGLYIVHHVLLVGLAPLVSNETIYYMACGTCRKN